MIKEADETRATTETAIAGAERKLGLETYRQMLPARDFVSALAGSLAGNDTPFSAQQGQSLVNLLVANSLVPPNIASPPPIILGGSAPDDLMREGKLAEECVNAASVIQAASSFLSPDQLALLNSRLSKNRTVVRLFNFLQSAPGEQMVGFTFGRR